MNLRIVQAAVSVVAFVILWPSAAHAESDTLSSTPTRPEQARADRLREEREREDSDRRQAEEWAREHGQPIRGKGKNGSTFELMKIENGRPYYYVTTDAKDPASQPKLESSEPDRNASGDDKARPKE